MRRCENGFVLNSILFMFLMVAILCPCTISKPRRERHGANSGSHRGSDDLNKRELRRTKTANSELQDNDHQGEKHGSRTLEELDFLIGSLIRPGTGSIIPQPRKVVEGYEDKRQKRVHYDPETDAGNETGKEKAAVEQCQNIWMPDTFVISVIVGTSAVGLWSIYWLRKKRFRHGNERAEAENDSPSRQDVRGPDITDIGRPQTALSNRGSGFAARKSAREIKDHHATGNESERNKLQNIETEEDTGHNANEGAAKDKYRADNEEGILQYIYNLRDQSRNMKMPKLRLISDIYTNPMITLTPFEHEGEKGGSHNHVQEVEIHELLKRSSNDSDKTTISVVYGAAGTGKTTLIQKIIHDWATGMKYQQFRLILPFKIQNLNAIEERITLSRLIVDAYPYLENYLDHLWMEPKRLLFIIDDLDQLHRPFIFSDDERNSDLRYRCTGPQSNCLVNDILRSLLQGQFLKGCSVLITSRLWKQETLHHVTVDSTLQVMGFSSEKVQEYFCRYLRHGQYAKCIVQFNEQNDILRTMCSSPLFCVTLASTLECYQPQREEETTMPVINHTLLLFDYVVLLLRACGYDDNTTQKSLIEVGVLAYKGIRRNSLLFSLEADEFRDLNICPPNFTSAFMIQYTDKQSYAAVYGFRHSVVRDFLAAFANILSTPIPRLKGLLDETFLDPDGRFRRFLLFLVGLSSQKSIDRLKLELGTDRSEVTSCITEWLTKNVQRRLMNMGGKSTQRTFLHTLYCLLEFGDNQITKEVLTPITAIKLNQLFLTSPDCAVLSRTLIYSEVIEELDLSSCLARPEEMKQLEHLLQKCVILRLNQNNLEDSGVKPLFNILKENDCKIQTLELRSNHLTDDCLQTLFSTLSTNHSVMQLNLSNSSQDERQANQFSLESLHRHVDNYAQQKEIRWLRYEPVGQDTASNILILITD